MKDALILILLFSIALTQSINSNNIGIDGNIPTPPTSQISNLLWETKSLGQVISFHFINDKQMVTTSQEGIISGLNIASKANNATISQDLFSYRKFIEAAPLCESNEKYLLCSYQAGAYGELFNIQNGQLLKSVDLPNDGGEVIGETLLLKKTINLNVIKSHKKLKVFNEKGVLYESKGSEEVIYDYFIDESSKTMTFYEGEKLKQIPTVKMSKAKAVVIANMTMAKGNDTRTSTTSGDDGEKKVMVTKERVFMINKGKMSIYDYDLKLKSSVAYDEKAEVITAFKHHDIVVIYNKVKGIMQIINKEGKAITKQIPKNNNIIHTTIKTSTKAEIILAYKEKDNTNTINSLTIDLLTKDYEEIKEQYAFTNTITNDMINAFNVYDNLSAFSVGKSIYVFNTQTSNPAPIVTYHNQFNTITFSELISFSTEHNNINSDSQYHTTFENLNQKDLGSIISNTAILLIQDIKQLYTYLKNTVVILLEGRSHHQKAEAEIIAKEGAKTRISQSLFLFTKEHEFIVLNALTGKERFKRLFKGLTLQKIIRDNFRAKVLHKSESVIELVFSNQSKPNDIVIYGYDLINNTIVEKEEIVYKYELQLKDLQKKMIMKNIPQVITKEHVNLPLEISVGLLKAKYHNKYSVEEEGKMLYCFKYSYTEDRGLIIAIVWNMKIEGLLGYHIPIINENFVPTYLSEGKIFYKYITENIVITFSKIERKTLLITIIQGQSGKIIKEISIPNIDYASLKYLYEDNWGIISYVKIEKGFKRNEIFAIELLKHEIEHSLLSLLDKLFKGTNTNNAVVNEETMSEDDLSIMTKTYVLSRHVKSISKSESEYNNANKFIVLLLENNQTFLIDRRTFSPRRPNMKMVKNTPTFDATINSAYVDPELPGYNAIVNLDHKFLLDPNYEGTIDNIVISPSQHESTFVICTIGNNINCYNVYPDKTFDALSSSFDYNMIGAFLFGCISVVYFLRKYTTRREFTDKFIAQLN